MKSPENLYSVVFLSHEDFTITLPNLQAKEIVHKPHILHLKLPCKVLLAILDQTLISSQYKVVDIEN